MALSPYTQGKQVCAHLRRLRHIAHCRRHPHRSRSAYEI